MSTQKETIHIDGMSCGHCVSTVKNALEATAGVDVEHVEIGKAQVQFDTTQVSAAQLASVVEDLGFEVKA
ncbi:MAG: cation transporter [Bacteroidota bacterium]